MCNAVGSTDDPSTSRAQFWSEKTGCDFYKRKCGILRCGTDAQIGGLMWIKRRRKFGFIMPICRKHRSDPRLNHPNHMATNKNIRLVACELTEDDPSLDCTRMEVGKYFPEGRRYEVSNVVGSTEDSGNKAQFWAKHAKQDFSKQKCGILDCGADAEVGGHMWIKRLSKFCFILPICKKHNSSPDLHYPKYKETKANVRLVARAKTEGMYE